MTEIILAISVFALLYALWRINKGEVNHFYISMIIAFVSVSVMLLCVSCLLSI